MNVKDEIKKVHLVLEFIDDKCKVILVDRDRAHAEKIAKRFQNKDKGINTYHVITKKLK